MDRVTGDPAFTPLAEWAARVHELFTVLTNAGFDEAQALTLIAGMLTQTDVAD